MTLIAELDQAAKDAGTTLARSSWFDRLPEDARTELLTARDKFCGGGYPGLTKSAFARLLIKAATDRGWAVCKLTGMKEWLTKH